MTSQHRSLPGQQAGSKLAYTGEGAAHSGRTLYSDIEPVAGGVEWVGNLTCSARRKDGKPCTANRMGDNEFCIGHLRGSKEEG